MGRIVDLKGNLFNPINAKLSSAWSNSHLKRSEVYNEQLKEIFQENLSAHRWMNWITGGSIIDLSTNFTKLIRERAQYE